MALTDKLTAIGDAIRDKTGSTDLLTLDAMPTAISGIETGGSADLPEEAFTITGDCKYRFANNAWNWFIERYGDRIITENLTDISYMFYRSQELEEIDFDINDKDDNNLNCTSMFHYCTKLKSIPKLNFKVKQMDNIFSDCETLRELSLDTISGMDFTPMNNATSAYDGSRKGNFYHCYSLRSFPMEFVNHGNPVGIYSSSIYNTLFNNCYVLDEVIGLPFPHYNAVWQANAFSYAFESCSRLKKITFALQEDGTPYIVNWKSQTIDLSKNIGYMANVNNITKYNSGITVDKQVTDDATYQALKNDPDWFTTNIVYSRYNHDSAVETINSLPDTSAYLATAGGTNTIKFKGASGSATDGGAINTLTEEEIAVATAKGWTVTLV